MKLVDLKYINSNIYNNIYILESLKTSNKFNDYTWKNR